MNSIYFAEQERRYMDDGLKLRRIYGEKAYKIWVDEWYKYKSARTAGKEVVEAYIAATIANAKLIFKKPEEKQWFDQ